MNRDFVEMLTALSAEGVEFLIVGACAVAVQGLPRATGDIDLWVRPSRDNATKVWNALERFCSPTSGPPEDPRISPTSPASRKVRPVNGLGGGPHPLDAAARPGP